MTTPEMAELVMRHAAHARGLVEAMPEPPKELLFDLGCLVALAKQYGVPVPRNGQEGP